VAVQYDAIIVGAGPAGGTVAYVLGPETVTVPLVGRPVYMVMRDRFDAFGLSSQ